MGTIAAGIYDIVAAVDVAKVTGTLTKIERRKTDVASLKVHRKESRTRKSCYQSRTKTNVNGGDRDQSLISISQPPRHPQVILLRSMNSCPW
jgi:hypothetical protein